MRYFKLEEIDEEEYLKGNCSEYYNTDFEQAFTPLEDKYLIAVDDKVVNKIDINFSWLKDK